MILALVPVSGLCLAHARDGTTHQRNQHLIPLAPLLVFHTHTFFTVLHHDDLHTSSSRGSCVADAIHTSPQVLVVVLSLTGVVLGF